MTGVADLVRERFGGLTEVQKLAMPRVLAGENVLILAPTGSGKTEAALLPILEMIKRGEGTWDAGSAAGSDGQDSGGLLRGAGGGKPGTGHGLPDAPICALYITPLRSLNRDLLRRFEWWCNRLGISHGIRHGDTGQSERAKQRKDPPKVLLTTIESLQALLMGRVLRRHLTNIKWVIVDEIHDVLDNKRGAQLSLGLERLEEIADFRRIGISATVADEQEAAKLLFGERLYALCEAGKNRKMDVSVEDIKAQDKRVERIKKLATDSRTLVFVNTRSTAEELGASLMEQKAPIDVHHGSLDKEVRTSAEDRFKSGALRSVICTSSLELGIDVGDVDLVIQYGSPHQVSRLIQRVGRSGHSLQATPRGIMISSDFDDMLECEVIKILAANGWMESKRVERGALDVIAHQLVGICLDFGRTELSKAHNILGRSYAYGISYDKLRQVALQLYGEGLVFYDEAPDGTIYVRAKSRAREYYHSYLSTIPKMKRYLMKDISSNRIISSLDEEFVVSLENGASFLSKGQPWRVVDITESEVLAEPGGATDIAVPAWTGEDIPVPFEVAQEVGRLRTGMKKDVKPLADNKTVVVEIVSDLVIVHACFGSRVNEGIARILSKNLSELAGESVRAVSDPYRIIVKLPFPMKEEHILRALKITNVRKRLEDCLVNSLLLKFRFLHVGRLFGLLSEEATVSSRFIDAMRYSVVYEEAVRSAFFRYFDVERTERAMANIKAGEISLVVDRREKPGFFAALGIERASGGESMGAFEPRERMVAAFKEQALSKTLRLVCTACGAKRFMHLAGAPERPACHSCGQPAYAVADREWKDSGDAELSAALIREFGKKALIALSTYGIGPKTADRVLKRLHRDEQSFYLDLLEAQKQFIKNKKFWKP